MERTPDARSGAPALLIPAQLGEAAAQRCTHERRGGDEVPGRVGRGAEGPGFVADDAHRRPRVSEMDWLEGEHEEFMRSGPGIEVLDEDHTVGYQRPP